MSDEERKTTHDSVCLVAKSKTIIPTCTASFPKGLVANLGKSKTVILLTCAASFPKGGSSPNTLASSSLEPLDWVASVVAGVFDINPSATKCLKSGVNANSVIRMAVGPHTSRTFPSAS